MWWIRSFHVRDSLANSIISSLARSHLQLCDFSTWCDSWLVEWFHHQVKLIPWRMVEGEYSWTIQNHNPPRKQSNIAMEMSNYLIYEFQWSSAIAYIITHCWSINEKSSKITIVYPCGVFSATFTGNPASAPGDAEQWALDPASRDVGSERSRELRTCLPRNFLKMKDCEISLQKSFKITKTKEFPNASNVYIMCVQ